MTIAGRIATPNHHSVGRVAPAPLPPTTPNQPSLKHGKNGGSGDQIEKDGSLEVIDAYASITVPSFFNSLQLN